MIGAADRYRELMNELLLQRELAGGDLPEEDEARFAAVLDVWWRAMTDEQQTAIEREFTSGGTPSAPPILGFVDEAAPASHVAPRRAA